MSILAAVVLVRGGSLPPRRTWPGLALLGLLMIGFGNGFVVWAEQFVPSGLTAVVIATSPFWMVASEAMFGGERLGRGALAGLIVGFAGIVLLVWPDIQAGGAHAAQFAGGLVALQLACAGWAAGSSFAKRHKQDDIVAATAMQMLFGGVLMLAIGSVAGEWPRLVFTPRTASALTYLTLAGSLGAFLAYSYALRHLPVSTVSLYAYINPIIAVVLGALCSTSHSVPGSSLRLGSSSPDSRWSAMHRLTRSLSAGAPRRPRRNPAVARFCHGGRAVLADARPRRAKGT